MFLPHSSVTQPPLTGLVMIGATSELAMTSLVTPDVHLNFPLKIGCLDHLAAANEEINTNLECNEVAGMVVELAVKSSAKSLLQCAVVLMFV